MSDAVLNHTTAVRRGHQLDRGALEGYLAGALADFHGPLEIRQFEGGQSNPTYFLRTPSRDYVLRKKPAGQLLPSAHAVEREHRVISALASTGIPVPTSDASSQISSAGGTGMPVDASALMTRCSRSTACAEGSSWPAGFLRST